MRTQAEKKAEVERLRESFGRATAVVVADYRGLSVPEANDLRARLRSAGEGQIEYRVAKNTLVRLAVRDTPSQGLGPYLDGPTALAFAYEEPATLARTLVDYAKQNEKFELKGGLIEGEVFDLDSIRRLAALPTKDELRSQLMATLQAPSRKLAGTLYAVLGNLRNVLERRAEQLEG